MYAIRVLHLMQVWQASVCIIRVVSYQMHDAQTHVGLLYEARTKGAESVLVCAATGRLQKTISQNANTH